MPPEPRRGHKAGPAGRGRRRKPGRPAASRLPPARPHRLDGAAQPCRPVRLLLQPEPFREPPR
ncbi:hypothetical protein E2320_014097 [Naja naja]|nr:hypothetical protein E2320_014097 [Naja naja]